MTGGWSPIAAAHDLAPRHVFHGQLRGREFAVWRADDGYINIWENRCLHRGVRLSIGINDGRELKCQYHGWRYANRTAGCTYIPAHPADAPARTIANRTYPARENYGLIWTAEQPAGEPEAPALDGDAFALRGIPVNAPAALALEHLKALRFQPSASLDGDGAEIALEGADDASVTLRSREGVATTLAIYFVQSVDSNRCVIRGVLDATPHNRIAVLRHHNARLSELREAIERDAARGPTLAAIEPTYERVSPELAEMPELATHGRKAALRVEVSRKWRAAEGVAGFDLKPIGRLPPTFQPGSHIDVHMPNGMVRPYSLVNAPGETAHYTIGVKRETMSKGGSHCMHDVVREGDVLAISEPRNNFPLRRDAARTLLIAGGIGITPLLAMAQTLRHSGLNFALHLFAQGPDFMAFPERLATLGDSFVAHSGLDPAGTAAELEQILSAYRSTMQVYLCGPGPMLESARAVAARLGWPEAAVHYEYFKNANPLDASSHFEVALARSAMTIDVPSGTTILEALRAHGVDLPSSCEQGACGTCVAGVLEGEPDHQDVYLTDAERESGARIITCVSRSKSPRLVLDV